jgi:ABC-type nitrate/sulfonate/bicarbonate transport system ATPase subunit
VVFSHRPGHIKAEFPVPLPRPRDMDVKSDRRFIDLENTVWKLIEEEVKAAGGFAKL